MQSYKVLVSEPDAYGIDAKNNIISPGPQFRAPTRGGTWCLESIDIHGVPKYAVEWWW